MFLSEFHLYVHDVDFTVCAWLETSKKVLTLACVFTVC